MKIGENISAAGKEKSIKPLMSVVTLVKTDQPRKLIPAVNVKNETPKNKSEFSLVNLKSDSLLHLTLQNCPIISADFKQALATTLPGARIIMQFMRDSNNNKVYFHEITALLTQYDASIMLPTVKELVKNFELTRLAKYEIDVKDLRSGLSEFKQAIKEKYEKSSPTLNRSFNYEFSSDTILMVYGYHVDAGSFMNLCKESYKQRVGGFARIVFDSKEFLKEWYILSKFNGKI
jgi:hypothetical protein